MDDYNPTSLAGSKYTTKMPQWREDTEGQHDHLADEEALHMKFRGWKAKRGSFWH